MSNLLFIPGVAFYVGIKDIVFGRSGKDKVEKIIKEDMKHITSISSMLADMESRSDFNA